MLLTSKPQSPQEESSAQMPEPNADTDLCALTSPSADLTDLTDAALLKLIDRIVLQDERALTQLYDAAAKRVLGLAMRITGGDTCLSEEIVEDTFWQAWRQAPRFDATRGSVLAWLTTMARSRALDALRKQQSWRYEELPEHDDDAAHSKLGTPVPQPPDILEISRSDQRLHQALQSLEAQPRQLVALSFFKGLTHEEIADLTRLPLGTVKSQIRRALMSLKKYL